jgi:hypothetical protein
MKIGEDIPSSFRDPSGFLFTRNSDLYRQINQTYRGNYDFLINSGLYRELTAAELLIPHIETDVPAEKNDIAYKVIQPEVIPFISYPYEWCFSQLKDAALTTLRIQKIALNYGMSLKDASAYNIQFKKCKPVLIDTLSFEKYQEGEPWIAYRQFCQHFLAPLALMSHKDIRLSQLLRIFMDGVPLDLASNLLPGRTRLMFGFLTHIHLHAKSQKHYANKSIKKSALKISKHSLTALVDNLETAIRELTCEEQDSEWANYYEDTNYTPDALEHKKQIVAEYLDRIKPESVWDLGANTGLFSHLAATRNIPTMSFDSDPFAVERNYQECKKNGETHILPLLLDIANPSPAIGWGNQERMSLSERGPADTILALALIHHLVISNNTPFEKIVQFLKDACKSLIIEFVPKNDVQVQRLLSSRQDVFPDYKQECFEKALSRHFLILESATLLDTKRIIYLMRRR